MVQTRSRARTRGGDKIDGGDVGERRADATGGGPFELGGEHGGRTTAASARGGDVEFGASIVFDSSALAKGEVAVFGGGGSVLVEERVRRRVEIRQENGSVLVENVDEIDESSRFVLCGRDGKSRHVLDANHLETSGELYEIRRVRS